MKFNELYRVLAENKYYLFSFKDLAAFFPHEKASNLQKRIYTWNKKGLIYALKQGLYELTYPKDFVVQDLYVANHLYNPSYVSLQTALSNYSIIPDIAMQVTSITTKPTRRFRNKHGLFIYRSVKPGAFCGYSVTKVAGFEVLLAEPEKALVDYLYFSKYDKREIDFHKERFDIFYLRKLSKRKLNKYADIFGVELEALYAYLRSSY